MKPVKDKVNIYMYNSSALASAVGKLPLLCGVDVVHAYIVTFLAGHILNHMKVRSK